MKSYDRLASLCRWTIIWHASSTGIKPLVFRCMHLVFLITSMNSMHIWFVYEINTWKDKWNSFVLEFLLSAVICCSSWWSIAAAVPLYEQLKWGTEIVLLDASCLVRLCSLEVGYLNNRNAFNSVGSRGTPNAVPVRYGPFRAVPLWIHVP